LPQDCNRNFSSWLFSNLLFLQICAVQSCVSLFINKYCAADFKLQKMFTATNNFN
jgi:hypothetical protein